MHKYCNLSLCCTFMFYEIIIFSLHTANTFGFMLDCDFHKSDFATFYFCKTVLAYMRYKLKTYLIDWWWDMCCNWAMKSKPKALRSILFHLDNLYLISDVANWGPEAISDCHKSSLFRLQSKKTFIFQLISVVMMEFKVLAIQWNSWHSEQKESIFFWHLKHANGHLKIEEEGYIPDRWSSGHYFQ